MDYLDSVWQIGIIALVAGALIGALAYRLLAPSLKQADQARTELDQAKEELESYRASVNQHFDKTSELVNDLTQNYVRVYQHLAEGAQTLGDSKTFDNLLEQHQGRVSIAVDEETRAAGQADDNLVVEPASTPAESGDEHAEPLEQTKAARTGAENPRDERAESTAETSSEKSAETREPVLNVAALDEAAEQAETGARDDANRVVTADEEKKADPRATAH